MARFIICLTLIAATWLTAVSQIYFFETDELPDVVQYLPPPPELDSPQFAYDTSQYEWGKTVRETARGDTALIDSDYSIKNMCRVFSKPFGITISQEHTPAIYRMLYNSLLTIARGTATGKVYYNRRRPFQYFNEPLYSTEKLNGQSYPSAHTTRGWAMALLLLEVNPDAQNALLRRAYDFGQSRVIVGAHWQSDVEAGRYVASACYARLHTSPEFLDMMAAARQEFERFAGVNEIVADDPDNTPEQWYTIDGRPATPDTRGFVFSRGKKAVKP